MQEKMDKARKQAVQYTQALEQKYDNLRLKKFAVTSLGFEQLWWEEI